MDYSLIMLEELQKLENLSEDYKGELKFLSKKIRKDFWNTDYNTEKLAKLLHIINGTYEMVFNCIGYFDLSCIIEYVKLLAKYCCVICPDLNGVQRPVVEPVQPPKLIAHVHGDLFPGLETQIPQFQQGLVLRVLDSLDFMDDVFFRLHQLADILVDLCLQLNDGKDGVLHAVEVPRLTSGHIRISRSRPRGEVIQ